MLLTPSTSFLNPSMTTAIYYDLLQAVRSSEWTTESSEVNTRCDLLLSKKTYSDLLELTEPSCDVQANSNAR